MRHKEDILEEIWSPYAKSDENQTQRLIRALVEVLIDVRDQLARQNDILESIGVTVYTEKAESDELIVNPERYER